MSDAELREHERLLAQQGIQVRCVDLVTHVVLERSKVEAHVTQIKNRLKRTRARDNMKRGPVKSAVDGARQGRKGDLDRLRQLIREADEAAGREVGK